MIVVAVLCLIGAAGWTVFYRQKDTSNNNAISSSNSTGSPEEHDSSAEKQQPVNVPTTEIKNSMFSVSIPKDWNFRKCMDTDGLSAITVAGDGDMRCIWD